jgi:hypothetical protein
MALASPHSCPLLHNYNSRLEWANANELPQASEDKDLFAGKIYLNKIGSNCNWKRQIGRGKLPPVADGNGEKRLINWGLGQFSPLIKMQQFCWFPQSVRGHSMYISTSYSSN